MGLGWAGGSFLLFAFHRENGTSIFEAEFCKHESAKV